ncbi:uncharacterized protein F5Z01DRAFT_637875 [Emericellopsis atlantica]|uniref:Uncharacterized protein n=1 Tax=Emericellopsis atlantica TaxID=2614577 RepID=A0A9P7ZKF5_9HYPO|nr:uncharacterized protein F5Z01DRAFT_637875 [Emericellopsis atlantica]KAG9253128.1 hypothetical protein F5Z01DRAFT_637875 [Emericellopsis atlantica]
MPSVRSFLAATFALGLLDQAVSRTIKPSRGLTSDGLDPAKDIAARDPAYASDFTISIIDGSLPAPCGFGNICCSPICNVRLNGPDDASCLNNGYQNWDQECYDNFNNYDPDDRRDINGCEGWTMRWQGGSSDDGVFITVEEKATGSYIRFYVDDCQSPDFIPLPNQCAAPGGGCTGRPSGTYIAG